MSAQTSSHLGRGMLSLLVWNTNMTTCLARIFSTNLDISAGRPHLLWGHGFSVSGSAPVTGEKHKGLFHVTLASWRREDRNDHGPKVEQWVRFQLLCLCKLETHKSPLSLIEAIKLLFGTGFDLLFFFLNEIQEIKKNIYMKLNYLNHTDAVQDLQVCIPTRLTCKT